MPFVKYKREGLTTMREAARLCGVPHVRFWELVREDKVIPAPATPAGHRNYYDEAELANVVKVVTKLRKEGRIK